MAGKTFKASTRKEPLDFEIEYTDAEGEVHTEPFRARPRLGATKLLRFANAVTTDDETGKISIGEVGTELVEFLTKSVVASDKERFLALINDEDKDIELSVLVEVGTWLAGEYSGGRPTGEDSPSTSAASPNGGGSTDGRSLGVTTYSREEYEPTVSTT